MNTEATKCWKCLTCKDGPEFETFQGINRHLRTVHRVMAWLPTDVQSKAVEQRGIGWFSRTREFHFAEIIVLEDEHGKAPIQQEIP